MTDKEFVLSVYPRTICMYYKKYGCCIETPINYRTELQNGGKLSGFQSEQSAWKWYAKLIKHSRKR